MMRTSHTLWAVLGCAVLGAGPVVAQTILHEDFNGVSETGGGVFLQGAGFALINNWDDGITGENAFAGTGQDTQFGAVAAMGSATAGVAGSGAGVMSVTGVTFNLLDESFAGVTGTGGGAFLVGNGQPDTFNFTLNWDDGITGEGAFAGTFGGAVLLGSVSAQGIPAGGQGADGSGQLVVDNVDVSVGGWFAGLQWEIGPFPGAAPLANPGFEEGPVAFGLQGWNTWGNVFTENIAPRTGNQHAKFFGTFSGNSGFFQSLPAQPGQTWQLHGFVRTNSDDSIFGTANSVVMRIEFLDASQTIIGTQQVTILDGTSPQDTWIDVAPLQATAPAGTVEVRPVFEFVQPGFDGGSAFIDDVSFKVVSGPVNVDLNNFSLFATFRGTANSAAGEMLGDVQLRIEDSDGNRLLFRTAADGSWQTIGGPLSTAIEADANGQPASGVFNVNSSRFVVVLAFDNDTGPWGTGGTLEVDDLVLTNSDPQRSSWFAGLFWDNLTLPVSDPNRLRLTADVKGDVPGGEIELRLEAQRTVVSALNEDFSTVTGTGGDVLLDPNALANGTTFGFSTDWDEGITGEGAFGGVFGQVDIFPGGGIFAEGVVNGDANGGGAGRIRVENMIIGPGGGWFAGLDWGDQTLASTDLSQVVLTADVKGTALSGGSLGEFELRIEDAQGDRLFFPAVATGDWQHIGGPLSTAQEGPALGGGGDGHFDLDSPTYTVVVSFINPETTWVFGGELTVDNLFLTPASRQVEIGRIAVTDIADGSFHTIGGLLSSFSGNLGDTNQRFETVTGTGGGVFDGFLPSIDDGIEGDFAFAGTFNGGTLATTTAEGCLNCGVSGSGAIRLSWSGASPGYFVGVAFDGLRADLTGDLSQIDFSAKVRGIADQPGQTLGHYILRLEDAQTDFLAFEMNADGTFQTVGGPLSTATPGSTPDGDGSFDFTQSTYKAVLVVVEPGAPGDPSWGDGGTLIIDDLHLTGVGLNQADTVTVTVAYRNELSSWGTDGTLTVDNLNFDVVSPCVGDLDGDGSRGLSDLSILLSNFGIASGATPDQGDLDHDGDVDLSDLSSLLSVFGSPCP